MSFRPTQTQAQTAARTIAAVAPALLLIVGMAIGGRPRGKQTRLGPRKESPTTSPAKPAPTAGHKPATPRKSPARPARPKPAARPKPTTRPAGLKSNQASKRSNGSAKVLAGKVCLIHLYVRDGVSSWSARRKQTERRRMASALAFLTKQGRRYRRTFTFVEQTLPEVTLKEPIPTDMFHSPSWIENAIRKAARMTSLELIRHCKAEHHADHAMILLHVNKRATSFNLTFYKGIHRAFYAERVVMYSRYADGRPTCAASYAHEILHAFGAGELYFPFDRTPTRKALARKLFPNDVMLRVAYKIDSLTIGPYTAYRIGWRDRLDEKHKVFEE